MYTGVRQRRQKLAVIRTRVLVPPLSPWQRRQKLLYDTRVSFSPLVGYPKWKVELQCSGNFPQQRYQGLSPVGLRHRYDRCHGAWTWTCPKTNNFAPNEYRGVVNSSGLVVYKGSTQEIKRY